MANIAQLLTEHIEIWTGAETEKKSGRGRASGSNGSVYGVKKLRELILELAVRGKLVPQDPNDEPASKLLKRIQAEKAKLIAEGKLKKEKPLAPIAEEEKPFELPEGWEWVRFSEFVLSIMSGGTPSKNKSEYWNGSIPWASVKDLNVEKYLEKTEDHITKEGLIAGSKLANKGDLIICTRMGLGKIAIAAVDVAINQDLKSLKLTSFLSIDYFIKFYSTLKIAGSGMTVAGIRQEELLGYCVPLPPLAEQHRIVAKVDELMALCDQLEQQHSNAQEAHETLVSHLLATLTQSQNAAEFNANWQRIHAHFDLLFTTEASIDALKQTLLQLAVMGKLVPQDPNDEPASELLKRIQAEKAQLIKEGKLKKEKPLAPIAEEEIPFELPQGWEWVRLGNVVDVSSSKRIHVNDYVDQGVPFFRSKEIGELQRGEEIKTDIFISNQKYQSLKNLAGFPKINDLMLTSVGTIGNTWLSDGRNFYYKDGNITKISGFNILFMRFVQEFIGSPLFVNQVTDTVSGTAYNALTIIKLNCMAFPLPPIAEQHRIVAKVDVLMALCDQLKTRIQQASQQQQAIADALVAQAVA